MRQDTAGNIIPEVVNCTCRMDTAGNHEIGCPMRPHYQGATKVSKPTLEQVAEIIYKWFKEQAEISDLGFHLTKSGAKSISEYSAAEIIGLVEKVGKEYVEEINKEMVAHVDDTNYEYCVGKGEGVKEFQRRLSK